MTHPEKTCPVCGRRFEWRKKWQRDWHNVRYCSDRCRRRKLTEVDRHLEHAISDLLVTRTGSICPSDAARAVSPDGWRDLMEDTRMAARRLAAEGRIEIIQNGRVVDPSTPKGPIRIRLPTSHRDVPPTAVDLAWPAASDGEGSTR